MVNNMSYLQAPALEFVFVVEHSFNIHDYTKFNQESLIFLQTETHAVWIISKKYLKCIKILHIVT